MSTLRESKPRILIADDEPLIRSTCAALLRAADYEPVEADSAEQALELLADNPVALVISDIQMPGNQDLGFLRELAHRFPGLPVVLLTAHPSLDSAVQSFGLAAAYLIKPVDSQKLLSTLRQALDQYQTRQVVEQNVSRLKTWTRDLEQLSSLASAPAGAGDRLAAQAYVDISVHNLAASLQDLCRVVSTLASVPGSSRNMRSLELENAVRETVAVLEATRRNFKSKELGELRHRLQSLLSPP